MVVIASAFQLFMKPAIFRDRLTYFYFLITQTKNRHVFLTLQLVVCIKAVISHPSRQMTRVKCEKFKILISTPRKIATRDLKWAPCDTSPRLTLKVVFNQSFLVSSARKNLNRFIFSSKAVIRVTRHFRAAFFYPIESSMFSFAATHSVEAIKWRDDWHRLSGNPINRQTCRVKCQEEETIRCAALSAYQFSH